MIKILFLNIHMHHKNLHALKSYKNIEITMIQNIHDIQGIDLSQYDCVYSPAIPINVSLYPNTRFLFGPHFSIFPDERILTIQSVNTSYIILSEWIKNIWSSFNICNGLHLVDIPFGVDTARFVPTSSILERDSVFIYFKGRDSKDLDFIVQYMNRMLSLPFRIFSYSDHYSESEYLEYLQKSRFGIWIDAHESQGFALQEALSCDVPLLVWNITSMKDEYGSNYPDYLATTIPYWDSRCGSVFYNRTDFIKVFEKFIGSLNTFRPREYILEHLSMDICEKRFIDTVLQKNN